MASIPTQGVLLKRLIAIKSLASVALALGAIAAAPAAQASSNVYFSIGVQGPARHAPPMPVYVQPRSNYMPMRVEQGRFDHHRRFRGPHWQGNNSYRDMDRDGDGVRNRFDRQPNNSYRR